MLYRFNSFELDTEAFEIRADGIAKSVEPKVYDLICFLAKNPGRVLSKNDLIDEIWEGRIVSDSAVSTCIREARRVLGDSGDSQNTLRTIRGRGVQFIAEVEVVQIDDEPMAPTAPGSEIPEKPSIAVLPFDNFGSGPEDDFFAAGLTEEIIANLSRFKELFVYSRSTTTTLTQGGADIRELRQKLGVDFVIEGSVRKSSNAVRVTFQLIDAATDGHLLAERFERDCTVDGVFQIQDRIALLIAARVASRYGPVGTYPTFADRKGRSRRWETFNWTTRYYQYLATRDAALHADIREGLTAALEHDPLSADGWATLAIILLDEYRMHINERPTYPALDEALDHAKRSVACDPHNAFAYQALAIVLFHCKEYEEFRGAVEKSLALNPGRADALTEFAQCYYLRGDYARALELVGEAIEINPIQNGQARLVRAGCYFMQDRLVDALAELKKAPMPDWVWHHAYLTAIYIGLGEDEKAEASARRMLELYPDFGENFAVEIAIMSPTDEIIEKFAAAWRSVLARSSVQSP